MATACQALLKRVVSLVFLSVLRALVMPPHPPVLLLQQLCPQQPYPLRKLQARLQAWPAQLRAQLLELLLQHLRQLKVRYVKESYSHARVVLMI